MFWKKNGNKILLVNGGSKKFGLDFLHYTAQNNLDCRKIRTYVNSAIVLDKNKIDFYESGEFLNLSDYKYAFIRVKTMGSQLTSIFCEILNDLKINYNDKSNIEHTMGDEKITQMVRFAINKIPIPKTMIFSDKSFQKNIEVFRKNFTFPCVMKTNGSKGRAVWKITSEDQIAKIIEDTKKEIYMVQEYIPNQYDVRVVVAFGKIVGAIERHSSDGFYNNVAMGGVTKVANLSAKEKKLSLAVCKIMKLELGGVDFVRVADGIKFFEVNKGPVVYGFQDATRINVPEVLVKNIKKII